MAQAKAILRNHPTSPRKMRYLVDTIRGVDVEKALNLLRYSTKHTSKDVEKLLVSAINNWKQANEGLREEDSALYVKEIFVDAGTTIKRFLPAPHGRAYKMRKRSNHVTLIIDSRTGAGTPVEGEVETEEVEVAPEAEVETVDAPVAEKPKKARKTKAKKTEEESTETNEETTE
jgi:large subunit ribosomal protein L22